MIDDFDVNALRNFVQAVELWARECLAIICESLAGVYRFGAWLYGDWERVHNLADWLSEKALALREKPKRLTGRWLTKKEKLELVMTNKLRWIYMPPSVENHLRYDALVDELKDKRAVGYLDGIPLIEVDKIERDEP